MVKHGITVNSITKTGLQDGQGKEQENGNNNNSAGAGNQVKVDADKLCSAIAELQNSNPSSPEEVV